MTAQILPPNPAELLAPFLPALPPAAISTQPAIGILPLLSPILRQRVNILSSTSTDPWLRLLCYDVGKAAKLAEIAQNGSLEPHPVSGEVEVDWDYDAEIRFRRVDQETLQALVVLESLGLAFQLVYCVNDQEGGGDGWRVGEVTVVEQPSAFSTFGGVSSISEAERQFVEGRAQKEASGANHSSLQVSSEDHQEEDDDDDYWARYDATPSRTPAQKRSPAPASMSNSGAGESKLASSSAEADYYAQYDDVQPAMDPHDPDEEMEQAQLAPPLGLGRVVTNDSAEAVELNETQGAWTLAELDKSDSNLLSPDADRLAALVHPRPESSASSNVSDTIAKLEATAGRQEQNEFGVKKHVSRSIRSLFLLARSSGIDREEFERLVHSELDVLSMMEDSE